MILISLKSILTVDVLLVHGTDDLLGHVIIIGWKACGNSFKET